MEMIFESIFAFVCGIWNSFVDLVLGILQLILLVLKAVKGITDTLANGLFYMKMLSEHLDNIIQTLYTSTGQK